MILASEQVDGQKKNAQIYTVNTRRVSRSWRTEDSQNGVPE